MKRRHGDMDYFLINEGIISTASATTEVHPSFLEPGVTRANPTAEETKRLFRFGRMFPRATAGPPPEGLVKLGNAMLEGPKLGDHLSLPAGFTYLAQFIAHDVSFDPTEGVPGGLLTPEEMEQGRTPSLDLDSLYGNGPLSTVEKDRRLYGDDHIHLALGHTEPDSSFALREDYDLLRAEGDPEKPSVVASIGDARNDDNLAVAQTTVAFIKFHNAVVDDLAGTGLSGDALLKAARERVVRHYQWIIVHDLLPRIIDRSVLDEVLANPPKFFKVERGDELFIPVEFSFAAYRFGHSLVRESYEWNRFHQTEGPNEGSAKLNDLFRFSGISGKMAGGNAKRLPSDWIIDWTRFHDFSGFADVSNSPKSNKARRIGTSLNRAFKSLPGFLDKIPQKEFRSLAVMDLIRGWKLGLPSGQAVLAKILEQINPPEQFLTDDDILDGPHKGVIETYGFHKQTPLWYYILKEAEKLHGGNCLGPVGSRIVAETLVGFLKASPSSILAEPGWRPDLGQVKPSEFSMADLLVFGYKRDVNPLG